MSQITINSNPDVIRVGKDGNKCVSIDKESIQILTKMEQGPARDVINRTLIDTATYEITLEMLIPGINIFGVDFDGTVNVAIPASLPSQYLLYIVDESETAQTNNIVITPV